MKRGTILVTGSSGLVGSEAVAHFLDDGHQVVGIDNDMRRWFFGESASTERVARLLKDQYPDLIQHSIDIRDERAVDTVFSEHSTDIQAVIHCAAQPSHDWAAQDPLIDFDINARGTLGLLEKTRQYAPEASFVYLSTNKVYGDNPNSFEYQQDGLRLMPTDSVIRMHGFSETLSVDQNLHSIFGASKLSGDLLVQEYGRYFGMRTVALRGGCLTGPRHKGAHLHGFLSYLVRSAISGKPYVIHGYGGLQVRDNIHSKDVVRLISEVVSDCDQGEVYNVGGGMENTISILEAVEMLRSKYGLNLEYTIEATPRRGDHIWYATDLRKIRKRYPNWQMEFSLSETIDQIVAASESEA